MPLKMHGLLVYQQVEARYNSLILTIGKWQNISIQVVIGMKYHYFKTFQDLKLRKFLIFQFTKTVVEITGTGDGKKMGNTRLRQATFSKWESLNLIWNAPTRHLDHGGTHFVPKVKIFIWRAIHNFIPVDLILKMRHIHASGVCSLCNSQFASISHALFHSHTLVMFENMGFFGI